METLVHKIRVINDDLYQNAEEPLVFYEVYNRHSGKVFVQEYKLPVFIDLSFSKAKMSSLSDNQIQKTYEVCYKALFKYCKKINFFEMKKVEYTVEEFDEQFEIIERIIPERYQDAKT